MNSSKKIKTKPIHVEVKKEERKIPKPLIYVSSVLIVILIAAVIFDQLYVATIMSINGDKYKMKDLSYYFYSVESQYDYYNQMFGGQYWDMTFDETSGTTVREVAKQEAVQTALYTEILYKEAVANGYTLTDEEKATIDKNVTTIMDTQLPEAVLDKNDFDKEYLTDVLSKSTLVENFRKDKIEALNIDEEAIKAGIDPVKYRQYDIEYLFISTVSTDDSGNTVNFTEEEKKAAYDKLNTFADKAKTTEDWSTLIPEDENEVSYQTGNFIESDNKFDANFKQMMIAMNNDAISDIYETENGYYLVRMINNNSTEGYETAIKDAIKKAEDEGFQTVYEGIAEKYDYKTNDKALKSLTMGNITLVK